jgi:hypothetical protein
MARALSLVSMLAALAIGGWLVSAQGHSTQGGRTPSQQIDAARQAASALTFQQAETQLEQAHALNGTYAGASVAGFGVTLVRADAASYCLQTRDASSHLTGPGGTPVVGPC